MTSQDPLIPIEIEPPVDPILQLLVNLANSGGFSTGVTLSVNGATVIGDLIGFKQYMHEIASKLRNPDRVTSPQMRSPPEPGDEDEPLRILEQIASGLDFIQADWKKRTSPAKMIHLKNVEILGPDGLFCSIPGVVWRGHLHSVDGFILGKKDDNRN